ncbi:MAG: SufE family protein [Alphaproteobacteria bacterium]|nr:SufE family protein [Alphaproteobacteria bacterium]
MEIEELIKNFELLDDWEERYRYIIELGKQLPPFPEKDHVDRNKVSGCASQVWLLAEPRINEAGAQILHFSGDSDAHIVRGLIFLLFAMTSDRCPEDIIATDTKDIFTRMGLDENLTPQRANGFSSMAVRIRDYARAMHNGQDMNSINEKQE